MNLKLNVYDPGGHFGALQESNIDTEYKNIYGKYNCYNSHLPCSLKYIRSIEQTFSHPALVNAVLKNCSGLARRRNCFFRCDDRRIVPFYHF